MRTLIAATLLLFVPGYANAADPTSIDSGKVELVDGINNNAKSFGSEAENWKKEWPLEKVKRKPDGTKTADGILYCLSGDKGKRQGNQILERGDKVSIAYEGYMKVPANNSAGVTGAYTNQEKNLHGLNDEIKKRNQAAGCP